MSRTPAERNIAAEVRFVEEGHHVWLTHDGDRLCGRVHSDSRPGVIYDVAAAGIPTASGRVLVLFECNCPAGTNHAWTTPLGVAPCKHTAGLARRLEREHLISFDSQLGLWVVRPELVAVDDSDPFDGLT